MPCASRDYSCNTLITIRSPLGEVHLGAPDATRSSLPAVWMVRMYLAIWEAFAHRRQRRSLAALDPQLLKDAGISKTEAAREAGKPFWK